MGYTSDDLMQMVDGDTVPRRFLRTCAAHPDLVALRWKNDDDSWGEWTYRDYADRVAAAVTGYRALGLEPGQRIVLMMRNTPEFHVLDMAAYFCGATSVSIYNSSSPEQVEYLAGHCEALFGVAEDIGFLERFLKVRSDLPDLKHLGIVKDPQGLAPDDVFTYDSLMEYEPADLESAAAHCEPDQLATMIYTSGTTGPPKGVMLTHRNVCWTTESLRLSMEWEYTDLVGKRVVSYLPMAHIAERMTSHYMGVAGAYEVTCCPDPSQIADYAREVRPNIMFGVPRVWEKIHAAVQAALGADPEKGQQFADAIASAKPIAMRMAWDEATDEDKATYEFLDEVAFKGVRQLIGLDACELAISGAAPIPVEVLEWYRAIGVPMTEIYGMSESSGPMTYASRRIKPGTVGPAIPGCEVKLAEDGEVVCRGGNVFVGYFKEEEKTADTLDDEGWLHSGDIGEVDDDGYFKIVDRKKELIITAGGKNISPANLEAALKTIPLVGQAAAIGDNKPFVAALVTLDPDVAPVWAKQHDIEYDSLHDLARDPAVIEAIEQGLKDVMAQFNNAERVKKVTILGEEWLPDSDVLTPTSKLKRRGILARYNDVIDDIYA
jgi:long-chain acyl-CoA synthetase